MAEEKKLEGLWWLPQHPDDRIRGVLDFNDETGCRLKLQDARDAFKHGDEWSKTEIVNGLVSYGTPITLLYPKSFWLFPDIDKPYGSEIETSYASVAAALEGWHFDTIEQIKIRQIVMNFPQLEKWTKLTGVKAEGHPWRDKYIIKYNAPKSIQQEINNDLKLQLSASLDPNSEPHHFENTRERRTKEVVHLTIASKAILELDDAWKLVGQIERYFTFACKETVYIRNVQFYFEEVEDKDVKLRPVSLYRPFYRPYSDADNPGSHYLFFHEDINEGFGPSIGKWLEGYSVYPVLFDLFFAAYRENGYAMEVTFLNYVQALESFHSQKFPDKTFRTPMKWEQLVSNIEEAIEKGDLNSEHKQFFRGFVKFSNNRPTFQQRFKDLRDKYSIEDILDDAKIDLINVTRNYFTHWSKELKEKSANGDKLGKLNFDLITSIQRIIVQEIGFPEEAIKLIIEKPYRGITRN